MRVDTFQLTNKAIDQPLVDLAIAGEVHAVPEADFTTLDFGETRRINLR